MNRKIDYNPYNNLESTLNTNATKIAHSIQESSMKVLANNQLLVRYYLDDQDFNILQQLVYPRPVSYHTKKDILKHPHPVPAILNELAYNDCIRTATTSFGGRAIDIGGVSMRTPAEHHKCSLINDSRSEARHRNQYYLTNERNPSLRDCFDNGNFNDIRICAMGAQNCHYKASYAYMINVYDVPITDIPKIMHNHNISVLDCWMFLPHNLYNPLLTGDQTYYKCSFNNNGKTKIAEFHLNDSSNVYSHDYNNWLNYSAVTKLEFDNGCITSEHILSYGTFTKIRFNYCRNMQGDIKRIIPLSKWYSDFVVIANVIPFAFVNKFTRLWKNTFLVPRQFMNQLIAWCTRQKEHDTYSYPSMQAMADAISGAVYYNTTGRNVLLYQQIQVDTAHHWELMVSIYVLGAVLRWKRTQAVGKLFHFIRDNEPGLYTDLKTSLRKLRSHVTAVPSQLNRGLKLKKKDGTWNLVAKWHTHEEIKEQDEDAFFTDFSDKIHNLRTYDVPDIHFKNVIKIKTFVNVTTTYVYDASHWGDHNHHAIDGCFTEAEIKATDDAKFTGYRAAVQPAVLPSAPPMEHALIAETRHDYELGPNFGGDATPVAPPPVVTIGVNCILAMTDVPGDGKCGIHAIEKSIGKKIVIPKTIRVVDRGVIDTPESWHSGEELAAIAAANNCSIIIHFVEGQAMCTTKIVIPNSHHCAKIMQIKNHYVAVECRCNPHDIYQCYIGDYVNVPRSANSVYVNAANHELIDGAGQAAAFVKAFPDYKQYIQCAVEDEPGKPFAQYGIKPIGDGFIGFFCAVAHQYSKGKINYSESNLRYENIFKELERFVNHIGAAQVYLPLIGTSIFCNDLCCFKANYLKSGIKHLITMCFFDANQKDYFEKAAPCRHQRAGYVEIASKGNVKIAKSLYDNSFYNKTVADYKLGNMSLKFNDLDNYIFDKFGKNVVIELAAAPGQFASCDHNISKNQWLFGHYLKGTIGLKNEFKPDFFWNDINELDRKFNKTEKNNVTLLLDYPLIDKTSIGFDEWLKFINTITKRGYNFVGKVHAFVDENARNSEDRRYMQLIAENVTSPISFFLNDATQTKSSEVYFAVYAGGDNSHKEVILDVNSVIKNRDEQHYDRQIKKTCQCSHDIRTNSVANWKVDTINVKRFFHRVREENVGKFAIKGLTPELLAELENKMLAEVKTGYQLKCIAGVAGCCKSLNATRTGCSHCRLIIAPFRSVKEQHQKAVKNMSVTFMSAIPILNDNKRNLKYIFCDEALSTHPIVLALYQMMRPDAVFIGLTDNNQVTYKDIFVDTNEFEFEITGKYIDTSYRVPRAFEKYIKRFVPEFISKCKNEGKISIKDNEDIPNIPKDFTVITNTNELADEFRAKGYVAITSHAVEGSSYPKVAYITHDLDKLRHEKESYVYTAITRATDELVVYANESIVNRYFMIEDTPISRALEAHGIIPHDDHYAVVPETTVYDQNRNVTVKETKKTFDFQKIDVGGVAEVLTKIYPADSRLTNEAVVHNVTNVFPENKNNTFVKIAPQIIKNADTKLNGARIWNRTFHKTQHGRNTAETLKAAIGRYTNLAPKISKDFSKKFVEGIKKFLRKDFHKEINVNKVHENLWHYTSEYLIALQDKIGHTNNIEDKKVALLLEHALHGGNPHKPPFMI
jgi:hypothetical protein